MKKAVRTTISFLLCLAMLVLGTGCSKKSGGGETPEPSQTPQVTAEPTAEPTKEADADKTNAPEENTNVPTEKPVFVPAEDYNTGEDKVLFTIPVGEGRGKVSYKKHPKGDRDMNGGPMDFYMDGYFTYIFDWYDGEMLLCREGEYQASLLMDVGGRDSIAADAEHIYRFGNGIGIFDRMTNQVDGWYKNPYASDDPNSREYLLMNTIIAPMELKNGKLIIRVMTTSESETGEWPIITFDLESLEYSLSYDHREYKKENGKQSWLISSIETGFDYSIELDEKSEFWPITYGEDGSMYAVVTPDAENAYNVCRVVRFAPDGTVLSQSDAIDRTEYNNFPFGYGLPVRVLDGHVYIMETLDTGLVIREVAMHGTK